MTEEVNVSYSFQVGGTAWPGTAAPATDADRCTYAYADCEQVPINEQTVMIVNVRKRKKMVVTRDVGNALTHCTRFASLSAHSTALCAAVPQLRNQQADVLKVLEAARAAGILVSGEEVAARFNTGPAPQRLAPTRVFIITCDRPAAVERLLDSMLAACTLTRHDQLFLIDDSRQPDNARRNQQLVATFNRGSAKSMLYVGAAAAAGLLAKLVAALPAQERGLRFLLDRERWAGQPSYGVPRTLALLLSVGYRALVLDDDIVCRAVHPPVPQPGIGFTNSDAREAWFYASTAELLQRSRWCEVDPLVAGAQALGKPLAAVLSQLQDGPVAPAALAQCQAELLSVLDGDSPVLATYCGSAGDPGTADGGWVIKLDAASIDRLLAGSAGRAGELDSAVCWLSHTRPTIALRGNMSALTGLDNTRLLPPYAPILRREDQLFASMTAFLYPHSAVLHGNWAVLHLPIDDRTQRQSTRTFAPRIGLGTLAGHLLRKIDVRSDADAQARLAALAGELRALGECPADRLLALCDVELVADCAALLRNARHLQAGTRAASHPAWQALLTEAIAQAQDALTASVAAGGQAPHWLPQAREAARDFADALAAWPLVREHGARITAALIDAGELQPAIV